ncbi:ABC transporter substrate-binding protein [Microlunatus soli]|uniref:Peptide/nickel transport system substrate-binding protein n=1 Tax=Microlunatus soli TaxID=630515 RepID=A0A1H2AJ80_9ACTN|nr:ABC transporter substrate-binding protein [Microlunatus soli]SDT45596.1 peptide/nickel transport system substrate-binding protein [Microlunatus soli]
MITGARRTALLPSVAVMIMMLIITGCSGGGDPRPTPSGSPSPERKFTIMTTDSIKTTDPAAVADTGSTMLTQNVFQRLMTADPTAGALKPDAARDCIFESKTTYECTLRPDLKFSNGDKLTSADVKFSIQRATRLDVPGSSASLLGSLRRIETPDDTTVRFILSRYDTQFPWALAAPGASIVDRTVYNSDEVAAIDDPIVGSGPFTVDKISKDQVELAKFLDYTGYAPAQVGNAVIRTMPDSASIEEAMAKHQTDVVWRGLSTAAQQRLQAQINASKNNRSKAGFSQTALPGARVQQLIWNPDSKHRESYALRSAIAGALQEDRTLDSVVPNNIPGHKASFPLGGRAKINVTWNNRIQLTLGYDPSAPNSLDLANQIRTRLEDTGGLSVLLRPSDDTADLQLTDRKAWTSTGLAWLQPVLEDPIKEEASSIAKADARARQAGDGTAQLNAALAELQSIAASEKVVLPISQTSEYVYAADNTTVTANAFGPGWQLGLWGMKVER